MWPLTAALFLTSVQSWCFPVRNAVLLQHACPLWYVWVVQKLVGSERRVLPTAVEAAIEVIVGGTIIQRERLRVPRLQQLVGFRLFLQTRLSPVFYVVVLRKKGLDSVTT